MRIWTNIISNICLNKMIIPIFKLENLKVKR